MIDYEIKRKKIDGEIREVLVTEYGDFKTIQELIIFSSVLKEVQDRIRNWEVERTKMREVKSERGFLISREGDIHIANVVIQELKDLSNSIAPRSNSPSMSANAEDLISIKEENQK